MIEDKASGTQLLQEIGPMVGYRIKAITPKGDKVMRLRAQTSQFENGLIVVPDEAAWLSDYLHEVLSFPMTKHDDQTDSTSQALAWMFEEGREPGIMAYYRQLAEENGHGTRQ